MHSNEPEPPLLSRRQFRATRGHQEGRSLRPQTILSAWRDVRVCAGCNACRRHIRWARDGVRHRAFVGRLSADAHRQAQDARPKIGRAGVGAQRCDAARRHRLILRTAGWVLESAARFRSSAVAARPQTPAKQGAEGGRVYEPALFGVPNSEARPRRSGAHQKTENSDSECGFPIVNAAARPGADRRPVLPVVPAASRLRWRQFATWRQPVTVRRAQNSLAVE